MFHDLQEVTQAAPHEAVEQEETIRHIKPAVRAIHIHQAIHALVEAIIRQELLAHLAVFHTVDRVEVLAHRIANQVEAVALQEVAVRVLPEVHTHLHARQEVIQADVVIPVVLQAEVVLPEVVDEVAEVEDNQF